MGLFGSVLPPIQSLLAELTSDPALIVAITYKRFDSQKFNVSLGHNVNVYTDYSISGGIRLKHNARSAFVSTAEVDAGDQVFMLKAPDVPLNVSLKDLIVDEHGDTLKVKAIDNIFDLAYSFTVEGGRTD